MAEVISAPDRHSAEHFLKTVFSIDERKKISEYSETVYQEPGIQDLGSETTFLANKESKRKLII